MNEFSRSLLVQRASICEEVPCFQGYRCGGSSGTLYSNREFKGEVVRRPLATSLALSIIVASVALLATPAQAEVSRFVYPTGVSADPDTSTYLGSPTGAEGPYSQSPDYDPTATAATDPEKTHWYDYQKRYVALRSKAISKMNGHKIGPIVVRETTQYKDPQVTPQGTALRYRVEWFRYNVWTGEVLDTEVVRVVVDYRPYGSTNRGVITAYCESGNTCPYWIQVLG